MTKTTFADFLTEVRAALDAAGSGNLADRHWFRDVAHGHFICGTSAETAATMIAENSTPTPEEIKQAEAEALARSVAALPEETRRGLAFGRR